ncbi:MAG TPA: Xaa-Pro peptidase family protein [Gaiellaceae bacterium]|nr:Xaa-Pro peptidase family protein [Gaiellaceae bacterium]
MNERIRKLRSELDGVKAATFLVTDEVNVGYLTGFESSNAAALVGDGTVKIVTDGRYIEAARALPDVEAVRAERELAPWLGEHLGELAEPPVAFEADHLTVAEHDALSRAGIPLVGTTAAVKRLRAVKDEDELEAVRRAARILMDAFERLAGEDLVGRTEAEVAWWMERTIREEGADAVAFDAIVASGPNASVPHHHPGSREIERGETVIVDAGARTDGYCSDCTRTFATGPLSEELQRAYAVCRAAQEEALAAVRPGEPARALDALARRTIEASGLADVLHGLGHGVGREIHEAPRLADTSDETVEAGNVVTVEPGVYLAGRGGVRIEDLVIVTPTGAEVLTPFTKDLLVLG